MADGEPFASTALTASGGATDGDVPELPPQLQAQLDGMDPDEASSFLQERIEAQQQQVRSLKSWLSVMILLRVARGFLARRRVAEVRAKRDAVFDDSNDDIDLKAEALTAQFKQAALDARHKFKSTALAAVSAAAVTYVDSLAQRGKNEAKRLLGDFSPLDLQSVADMTFSDVKKEIKLRGHKQVRGKREDIVEQLKQIRVEEHRDMLYEALRLGARQPLEEIVNSALVDASQERFFDQDTAIASGGEGQDANVAGHEEELSALMLAAKYCDESIVEVLLNAKCNPNEDPCAQSGQSALHFAAEAMKPRTIEALVRAGASANTTNLSGVTPLEICVVHNSVHCAHVLVEAGANPNVPVHQHAHFQFVGESSNDEVAHQHWGQVRSGVMSSSTSRAARQRAVEEAWVENQKRFAAKKALKVLSSVRGTQILEVQAKIEWARASDAIILATVERSSSTQSLMADVEIPSQIDLLHEEDLNRTTAVCAVIVRLSSNSPLVVNVSPEKVALREGDGILSVNGKTFATMHEFAALVQHTEKLVLEVVRLSEAPVLQQHLDRARDLQLERLSRITAQKANSVIAAGGGQVGVNAAHRLSAQQDTKKHDGAEQQGPKPSSKEASSEHPPRRIETMESFSSVADSLLHYSTRRRNVQMAITLINGKADVSFEELAFEWGPKCGIKVVKSLLTKPRVESAIAVNCVSQYSNLTPLAQTILNILSLKRRRAKAARNYDAALMDILLNLKRIDLGAKSGPGGLNPLHFSIQGRSSDLVDRLLQAKAKANTVTDHNESCLQLAARYGDVHICRKLLAKKAVVNFTDCAGATPLFVACAEGNHQVVEVLLHAKASTAMGNGEMAFDCGCPVGGPHRSHGPLQEAAKNSHIVSTIFTQAQKFGQKEVQTNRFSHCWPMFAAIRGRHDRVVRLLLNRKLRPLVDVNHIDTFGVNALALAASPLYDPKPPPSVDKQISVLKRIKDPEQREMQEEVFATLQTNFEQEVRKRARIITMLEKNEATTVCELKRQRRNAELEAALRRVARSKYGPAERYEKALDILRRVFQGFFARRDYAQKRYVAIKLQNIFRGKAVRRAVQEVLHKNKLRCEIIIVDGTRYLVAKNPPRHQNKVYTYSGRREYVGQFEYVNGVARINRDVSEEEMDLRFLHKEAKEEASRLRTREADRAAREAAVKAKRAAQKKAAAARKEQRLMEEQRKAMGLVSEEEEAKPSEAELELAALRKQLRTSLKAMELKKLRKREAALKVIIEEEKRIKIEQQVLLQQKIQLGRKAAEEEEARQKAEDAAALAAAAAERDAHRKKVALELAEEAGNVDLLQTAYASGHFIEDDLRLHPMLQQMLDEDRAKVDDERRRARRAARLRRERQRQQVELRLMADEEHFCRRIWAEQEERLRRYNALRRANGALRQKEWLDGELARIRSDEEKQRRREVILMAAEEKMTRRMLRIAKKLRMDSKWTFKRLQVAAQNERDRQRLAALSRKPENDSMVAYEFRPRMLSSFDLVNLAEIDPAVARHRSDAYASFFRHSSSHQLPEPENDLSEWNDASLFTTRARQRRREDGVREYKQGERIAEYTNARLRNVHGYFQPRHPFWVLLSKILGPAATFIGGIIEKPSDEAKRRKLGQGVNYGPFEALQLNMKGGLPTEVGPLRLDTPHLHTLCAVLAATNSVMTLNVRANQVRPAGLQLIAEMLMDNRSIISLDLGDNEVGVGGAEDTDTFDHNAVASHEGLEALAHALRHNSTLLELDLSNNFLGRLQRTSPRGAVMQGPYSHQGIATFLNCVRHNRGLIRLDLSKNPFAPMVGNELGLLLRSNHTLSYLNVAKTQLQASSMTPIGQGLALNMGLSTLDLSDNVLDADGAEALASGLSTNTTLRSLNLTNCRIWADGCAAVVRALQQRQSLPASPVNSRAVVANANTVSLVKMELLDLTNCLIMRRSPNFKEPVFAGIDALGELVANPKCGLTDLRLGNNDLGDSGCKRIANGLKIAIDSVNAKKNRYLEERNAMFDEELGDAADTTAADDEAKIFFINGEQATPQQIKDAKSAEKAAELASQAAQVAERAYRNPSHKMTAAEARAARIEAKRARAAEQKAKYEAQQRAIRTGREVAAQELAAAESETSKLLDDIASRGGEAAKAAAMAATMVAPVVDPPPSSQTKSVKWSEMSDDDKSTAREWIEARVQYVKSECRLALGRDDGRLVVEDQAKVRWARANGAITTVVIKRNGPETDEDESLFECIMPHQLDLEFGSLSLRLSEPFLEVQSIDEDSIFVTSASPRAIQEGDAILSINGRNFATFDEFENLLSASAEVNLEVVNLSKLPVVDEYCEATKTSIIERIAHQTKTEARASFVANNRDETTPTGTTLEKLAPTSASNMRKRKREKILAIKRAQIERQRQRKLKQYEELVKLTNPDPDDSASDAEEDKLSEDQRLKLAKSRSPLDVKHLDIRNNHIRDLGLARLIDVVRPDKHKHNRRGFLVAVDIDGNAEPIAFFRGKTYDDLYQKKLEEAKEHLLGSDDPIVMDHAARRLQSLYRRRSAIKNLRNLIRSVFRKVYDTQSGQYFYENVLTGETSWNKPSLLGSEDFEHRYRRVPIQEHNTATFIQARHRGRRARRWFREFLYNSWEWRIDPKTGEKYYRDRWKFHKFKTKPVLLVKWDLEPAEGVGELEEHRRERLERERRETAKERAEAEACLIWMLAKQLVEEEDVLHQELNRKKDRIKQKLAVAAKLGASSSRPKPKKVVFTGKSLLDSIGL